MKKTVAFFAVSALLSLCLSGCACEHENVIAATCTKGKVCADCEEVLSLPKPHDPTKATCTEPSRCIDCGEIQDSILGHTLGSSFMSVDLEKAWIEEKALCEVCEMSVLIASKEATSYVSDGKFIFSHFGFADGFDDASEDISGYTFESVEAYSTSIGLFDEDNYIYYKIEDEDSHNATVGMYSFTKSNGDSLIARDIDDDIKTINILIDGNTYVPPVVWAAVMAIDPALDYGESMEVGQSIIDNVGNMDGVTCNSINYVLYKDGAYHYLLVSAL